MKKQLSVIKTILVIDLILSIIQTIFLCIETDLKHIILSLVVYICLVLSFIVFIKCKLEVKKIYFETTNNDIKIQCPECEAKLEIGVAVCPECGFVFDENKVQKNSEIVYPFDDFESNVISKEQLESGNYTLIVYEVKSRKNSWNCSY